MRLNRRFLWRVVLTAVGLGVFAGLIAWYGFDDVVAAFAQAGWGVLAVTLFHVFVIFCDTLSWQRLFEAEQRGGLFSLLTFRWIGESVNNLLPVAQVGGDAVRARLASRAGKPFDQSGAATVVDFTLGLITEMVAALAAIGLIVWKTGMGGIVGWALLGVSGFLALILIFLAAQSQGLFGRLSRWATGFWKKLTDRPMRELADDAGRLDSRIRQLYRRPRTLAICFTWRIAAWAVETVELQLAMFFLGQPLRFDEAVILNSLTKAIRSLSFFIPAGLGAQEGGFVVVGNLLGLTGPTALALALIRRVREILLGLPGLLVWWLVEMRGGKDRW